MITVEARFEPWVNRNGPDQFTLSVRVRDSATRKETNIERTYPLDYYHSYFERIWADVGEYIQRELSAASKALDIAREE